MILDRFYSHQERLIYAELADGWSTDIDDLRVRVKPMRETHYLEGSMGEYIVPNSTVYRRESKLYADIEAYEEEAPIWNAPIVHPSPFPPRMSSVLAVAEAMAMVGMFSLAGLKAVSQVWGQLTFTERETHLDAERLTRQLLERLLAENLPDEAASQEHVRVLLRHWPLPMYDVDLRPIIVTLDELKAMQDRILWAEMGDPF